MKLLLDHVDTFGVIVGVNGSIFGHSGIGVIVQGNAGAPVIREGAAGTAGIDGGTLGVNLSAESLL